MKKVLVSSFLIALLAIAGIANAQSTTESSFSTENVSAHRLVISNSTFQPKARQGTYNNTLLLWNKFDLGFTDDLSAQFGAFFWANVPVMAGVQYTKQIPNTLFRVGGNLGYFGTFNPRYGSQTSRINFAVPQLLASYGTVDYNLNIGVGVPLGTVLFGYNETYWETLPGGAEIQRERFVTNFAANSGVYLKIGGQARFNEYLNLVGEYNYLAGGGQSANLATFAFRFTTETQKTTWDIGIFGVPGTSNVPFPMITYCRNLR